MRVLKVIGCELPLRLNSFDSDPWADGLDHSFCDVNLRSACPNVSLRRPYKSIEVAGLDFLRINQTNVSYPKVSQLLCNMRAAATQATNDDTSTRQNFLRIWAKKALPAKVSAVFHADTSIFPSGPIVSIRIVGPTATNSVIGVVSTEPSQMRPMARL